MLNTKVDSSLSTDAASFGESVFDNDEENSLKSAIHSFYCKHNPEKLESIGTIINRYKGFEFELVLHLIKRYKATEKSDLDIFKSFLSDGQQLEITGEQIRIAKNKSAGNNSSIDDVADVDSSKIASPTGGRGGQLSGINGISSDNNVATTKSTSQLSGALNAGSYRIYLTPVITTICNY